MKIGLVDVDSHNFPNFALMKISAWHKAQGHEVEWAAPLWDNYDKVYQSKIFTFSPDIVVPWKGEIFKGGTGYNIHSLLPEEIERSTLMDYSIYNFPFSIQFFSRGCIRRCPFCLVHDKEGNIRPVEPVQLNPKGRWIEVLDNNFFANPEWKSAIQYLLDTKQQINFHGVDIRIMNEEQAFYLNQIPLKRSTVHIAWDLPQIDLKEKLIEVTKYIAPWKFMCYILVGFNSTIEQDLYRIETCRELKIKPFVMAFRDYENKTKPSQYCKDLAQWVNKPQIFSKCSFKDFSPRKGFTCAEYLKIS